MCVFFFLKHRFHLNSLRIYLINQSINQSILSIYEQQPTTTRTKMPVSIFEKSIDSVGDKNRILSKGQKIAKIIGKSILLAGFLVALASVEMSSRFSVLNFAKDSQVLQNAANALSSFLFIGIVWAIGSTAVLYSSYGISGLVAGFVSNGIILAWIYGSYMSAFMRAAKENNLDPPKMFKSLV